MASVLRGRSKLDKQNPDIIIDGVELYEAHPSLNLIPHKYYASRDGQIYSLYTNKFLSCTSDKDGYKVVALKRIGVNSPRKTSVARVILMTFRGLPPADMKQPTVEHVNGDKRDNRIENLIWLEKSINSSVRVHTLRGEQCKHSILKEDQVREICRLLMYTKMSYRKIGLRFGVSVYAIIDIYNRESWTHITKDYDLEMRARIKTEPRLSEYPVILSIKDVERILGNCRNTVKKKLRNGEIYYYKEGRRVRIPKMALLEYIEKNEIDI